MHTFPYSENNVLINPSITGAVQIWSRVLRGLEWVAAAEACLISGVKQIETKERDLLLHCDNINVINQLRCIDDAFLVWGKIGGIGHTRPDLKDLDKLIDSIPNVPIKINAQTKNLRVTASFVGKRNYSRYDLEDIIGKSLANRLGLKFVHSHSKENLNTLWVRFHLSANEGLIGIRTNDYPCHRRFWRTESLPGSLHPPLAASIALLADLQPYQIVIDPFVGSGTLLIESGIRCPNLKLIGCDLSQDSINRAYKQAKCAQVSLKLMVADARSASLPKADRIISNPPWGQAVTLKGEVNHNNLIKALLYNLNPYGRCVVVMDKKARLSQQLSSTKFSLLLVHTFRISGRLAELIIIGSGPCFPNNRVGMALLQAWKTHLHPM